jgi:hypothetical protein
VNDLIRAAYRSIGVVLMLLGALVGAATCGAEYGRTHHFEDAR